MFSYLKGELILTTALSILGETLTYGNAKNPPDKLNKFLFYVDRKKKKKKMCKVILKNTRRFDKNARILESAQSSIIYDHLESTKMFSSAVA